MKSRFKKVYVLAPYAHHTGGVELAHQLVHKINEFGGDAYIVYINWSQGRISDKQDITPEYQKYNVKSTHNVEDLPCNIVVLPEVFYDFVRDYKNVTIGCWWMSVDNRYKTAQLVDCIRYLPGFRSKLRMIKHYRRTIDSISDKEIRKERDRVIHFYQSAYARHHLYKHKFWSILPLSDYINEEFIPSFINVDIKKDIVLYNPSKGYEFTKKIIEQNPDIEFIPLRGFSRKQLSELFAKAKVYIDFGNFPGKDRLSREAVVNGIIVITGMKGASRFYEDVPIQSKYKFEVKSSNIFEISKAIKDAIINYSEINSDFDFYRNRVLKEEQIFDSEIQDIFFIDLNFAN